MKNDAYTSTSQKVLGYRTIKIKDEVWKKFQEKYYDFLHNQRPLLAIKHTYIPKSDKSRFLICKEMKY